MTNGRSDILRRTTIELGPLRITREYRCVPLDPNYPFADAPRARSGGGWRAAAALGVVLAVSAGGLSVAATRAPMPRPPGYSISLPVPQHAIAAARPLSTKRVVAPATAPVPVRSTVVAPAAAHDLPDDTGSRAAAIAAAMRSGEVQEWFEAAGQLHGFVVVGEASAEGTQTCRALSVLTRAPGGADRVDQRRACLPTG